MSGKWWDIRKWLRSAGYEAQSGAAPLPPALSSVVGDPRNGTSFGTFVWSPGEAGGMSVSTVYRCVKVLSDAVAGLRLRYMRRSGGRMVLDERSGLNYLLGCQPQPERSVFDFWSLAVTQMLLRGDAYIWPRRVEGEVTDLVLLDNGTVSHDAMSGVYTVSDTRNGVFGVFGEADMLHLFLHSCDGRTGESAIAHAARTLRIARAGDEETLKRFSKGGTVRGIVSNDLGTRGMGLMSPEQVEGIAEHIHKSFEGGEGIVGVPGDARFTQISLSSADMQFLESRKFTVREICRFFGVDPAYVFDGGATNYKSVEMAQTAFLSMTLNPILRRIEAEFNRKLIVPGQWGRRVFEFDRSGVYSLDLGARCAYYKGMIEIGAMSVNDVRGVENMLPVEGGDAVLVSANLRPLSEAGDGAAAAGLAADAANTGASVTAVLV